MAENRSQFKENPDQQYDLLTRSLVKAMVRLGAVLYHEKATEGQKKRAKNSLDAIKQLFGVFVFSSKAIDFSKNIEAHVVGDLEDQFLDIKIELDDFLRLFKNVQPDASQASLANAFLIKNLEELRDQVWPYSSKNSSTSSSANSSDTKKDRKSETRREPPLYTRNWEKSFKKTLEKVHPETLMQWAIVALLILSMVGGAGAYAAHTEQIRSFFTAPGRAAGEKGESESAVEKEWQRLEVKMAKIDEYAKKEYGVSVYDMDLVFMNFPLLRSMHINSRYLDEWIMMSAQDRERVKQEKGDQSCRNLGFTVDYTKTKPEISGQLQNFSIQGGSPQMVASLTEIIKNLCIFEPAAVERIKGVKIIDKGPSTLNNGIINYEESNLNQSKSTQWQTVVHEGYHNWDLRTLSETNFPVYMSPDEYLEMVFQELQATPNLFQGIEHVRPQEMLQYDGPIGVRPIPYYSQYHDQELNWLLSTIRRTEEKHSENFKSYQGITIDIPDTGTITERYSYNEESIRTLYDQIRNSRDEGERNIYMYARAYIIGIAFNSGDFTPEMRQHFLYIAADNVAHMLTGPFSYGKEYFNFSYDDTHNFEVPADTTSWKEYLTEFYEIQENHEKIFAGIMVDPRARRFYNGRSWSSTIASGFVNEN